VLSGKKDQKSKKKWGEKGKKKKNKGEARNWRKV